MALLPLDAAAVRDGRFTVGKGAIEAELGGLSPSRLEKDLQYKQTVDTT
jgi:hypothetical protein